MNWLIISFLACIAFSVAEQYTDRYDYINVDEILDNKKLLDAYVKCLLDRGRCTPEAKELKVHVQDAMQTACAKCTGIQKKNVRKVVKYLKEKELAYWEDMKAKYDPGDKHKDIYEPFLAAED